MDAIDMRARELLIAELESAGDAESAAWIRSGGGDGCVPLRAIIAALTPPEGYVVVPVEPTAEMLTAAAFGVSGKTGQKFKPMMSAGYSAMLAARPEVP